VAMILGMIPAAMPWLDGSAFRQPLAITVIGGWPSLPFSALCWFPP
jgi:multidrug efflux pump subunit AcrB